MPDSYRMVNDKKVKNSQEEKDIILAESLVIEEQAILKSWQARMDAHDLLWTPRMQEDQINLMLGLVTIEGLRAAAGMAEIPLEWWVRVKSEIRAEKP